MRRKPEKREKENLKKLRRISRNVCLWVILFILQFGVNVILVSHFTGAHIQIDWMLLVVPTLRFVSLAVQTVDFWMRAKRPTPKNVENINTHTPEAYKAYIWSDCTHWMINQSTAGHCYFQFRMFSFLFLMLLFMQHSAKWNK